MKLFAPFIIALLATLALPLVAWGDKVHLKDGRVLDGEISREGDDFLYITYKIGDLERTEFVLRVNIERIERDDDAADAPAPATPADSKDTSPAPKSSPQQTKPRSLDNLPPGTRKIAFITLEEMVGPFMNAEALKKSVEMLADDEPDIVVIQINSGGGALIEVQKLSDAIQYDIKPKYRVVAWIESAISAAAMTAFTCEEIYMMKEGNIGAATAFSQQGGTARAMKGEQLAYLLKEQEKITRRGKHEPLVMRAMQVPTDLSCDIDANGKVTWRNDLDGQYIVSTDQQILTLNSIDSVRYGLARAIADSKNELATALGCTEWIEVGLDADEYQQQFRENVQTAQVRAVELWQKMNIALEAGNVGRARSYHGQLRGWVRRAPSLETYGAGGLPPLTPEFFRQVEEQIDELVKKQTSRRR